MDPHVYLFIKSLSAFFFCQDAIKTRSNCALIGCNLSKKHKLTLYKTQNGEPNYVDHKFFFNFYWEPPICTKPWGQTSKYHRAGGDACIVWLWGYMTSRSLLQCLLNTPWKYILLMPIFYLSGESPPSTFPL